MTARHYLPPRGRQKVGPLVTAAAAAGPVAVRVEPSRAAAQACVVIGFSFPVNHWVLDALYNSCASGGAAIDTARLDESVVAFAAFEAAREKLDGTTADAMKNKVVGAACGGQAGEFLISVTCAPTLSNARKCAGIVLQNLRWGTLYQRYTNWCRHLGVRADKAAFSAAAEEANRAVQRGVSVVITGRVSADNAGVAKTAAALGKKIKDSGPKEPGRRRAIAAEDVESVKTVSDLYAARPAPGLEGVAVHNFVDANVRGSPSHLVSGTLYVPKRKDAQASRLAQGEKPAKFAQALLRLGEETRGAVTFIAAKGCYVSTADLEASGPFDAALLETAIRGAFRP